MTFTVITASAGSGKTYALTHEIADRIERDGVRPSEIIATTFTTKAAAELAERVRRTLLDRGLVEQARAISSALISTVNSVAGTILGEHAIDAGLSPDIRVLDEDRQRLAFRTAIDAATAAASVAHEDLLVRLEHDGDEDANPRFERRAAWTREVREIATLARTNGVGADELRAAAAASFAELRADVLGEPSPEDLRRRWAHMFDQGTAALRAELEAGAIPTRSAPNAQAAADAFPTFARRLADPDRVPWSTWARLADVTKVPAPKKPGATVRPHFVTLEDEVREGLLANPAFQADVEALIGLILGTAADSLEAYARYKQELGLIDFVDQEVLTLRLVREDPRVRTALASRFRLLAVDEFQDTSPVQLDLFLALADLVDDVVWVGDPKQAIYGFRGTDPALMDRVVAELGSGAGTGTAGRFGPSTSRTLTHSWRSGQAVLDLAGAVFSRLFSHLPRESVVLEIPEERRATAARGRIETWLPDGPGTSIEHHARVIAGGVAELLADPEVSPGEVAVLVRQGSHRTAVVEALAALGIPTTGTDLSPLATREGMIVRAGLAAALDASDTLALTELVVLLDDHAAHASWFSRLTAAHSHEERAAVLSAWRDDPALARLEELRAACIALTPAEMISAVIDALDLPQRITRWTAPGTRRLTLDALVAAAVTYEDACRAEGRPVTLTGLRAHLEEEEIETDLSEMPDAVWVGTIHGAKGLEWRHVAVMVPKSAVKESMHGTRIRTTGPLDLDRPLAGRELRFRPRLLDRFAPYEEPARASTFARDRAARELAEAGRLFYVALTRAREVTALSAMGPEHALGALLGPDAPPLVGWDERGIRVDGRAEALPVTARALSTEGGAPLPAASATHALSATDVPLRPAPGPRTAAAARFTASSAGSDGVGLAVGEARRIGPALVDKGGQDWDRVGEAVHAYLALPLPELTPAQRDAASERLARRWLVERAVGPEALRAAGEAWHAFLADEFPGAVQLTEQPIAWWNEDAQAMQGWIDALLRVPDGSLVLVDHKTYPGTDPAGHVRERYMGQFDAYARALAAAGERVARMLVHLPLRGEVLEIAPVS
ncbi:UvrD-helicase domain-containing protein [Brachybacterium huguangmaarense]